MALYAGPKLNQNALTSRRGFGYSAVPAGKVAMDFTLSPEIEDLRLRVRAFIDKEVLPLEADPANFSEHENIPEERLKPVRDKAKKAGLWAPQSPKEYGGMELPIVAWAAIYEEAARSCSARSRSTAWRPTTAT